MKLPNTRNYIVIKDRKELADAMNDIYSRYIILEEANTISLWYWVIGGWRYKRYVFFSEDNKGSDDTTGLQSYMEFYKSVGKESVEKMKTIIPDIPMWESNEQLHYANIRYTNRVIKEDIFVLDCNSSFTYGIMCLDDDFIDLKKYMLSLYEKKKNAKNKDTRTKYKNLQNYLIGYFARVKGFVGLRSKIIENSNNNIISKMREINNAGGKVYLSNTDSIVTDTTGFMVMQKYISNDVGGFKIETRAKELYYSSSNCYQIDKKLVYSGVRYYARRHTDLIKGQTASQSGSLVKAYDLLIDGDSAVGKVRPDKIVVNVFNKLGEQIDTVIYTIDLFNLDI